MEANHSASAFGTHVLHGNENLKKTLNMVNSFAGKESCAKLIDVQSYINKNTRTSDEDRDYDNLAIFAEKLKDFQIETDNALIKNIDKELSDEIINPKFFNSDEYITSMNIDLDEEDFDFDVELDDGIKRTISEEI